MQAHIPELTSVQNPLVKHLARLRQRSHRNVDGQTLLEGAGELLLALAAGYRPERILVCAEFTTEATVQRVREQAAGIPLQFCNAPVFTHLAYREQPDGWLAVGPQPGGRLADIRLGANPVVLVAEAIEKPGNLGAMLRTADALGADAVILADPCTDPGNPNVIRASLGTVFTVPLATANGADTIAWLRQNRIGIVAALPETGLPCSHADLAGPVAIVCGEEHRGVSRTWTQAADTAVRIPMSGRVDSLNVSVAAAILLYEARRQRNFGAAHE